MRDLEPHNYLALLVRRLLFLQEEIDRVLHWAVVAYSGSVEEARKIKDLTVVSEICHCCGEVEVYYKSHNLASDDVFYRVDTSHEAI